MSICEGEFLKIGSGIVSAKARITAGFSFFDSSEPRTEVCHVASGKIEAKARIKSGKRFLIGNTCSEPATALAEAQGSGSFTFATGRSKKARAIALAKTGFDFLIGTASLTSENSTVYKFGCGKCALSGDSVVYGLGIINQAGDIVGRARLSGDWVIRASSPIGGGILGTSSVYGNPNINYSGEVSLRAKASIKANQFYSEADIEASASLSSNSVVFLPNGSIKLDPEGITLLNYLPQYMQDGNFIKKIIQIYSSEMSKAIVLREGSENVSTKEGVLQQFFVSTATWGLALWESSLGIEVQPDNTDYAYRRGLVMAQISGRKNESEFWFKKKLEDISGGSILINPGIPSENPYSIEIETNTDLGEQAPDSPILASSFPSPGNLNGTYSYKVTFVFATGETDAGASESNSATVSDQKIILSDIPVSGSSEVYSITNGSASSGTFKLKFSRGGEWYSTAPISYNSTAADLKNKLSSLENIGENNITVSGSAGGPWLVTFTNGLGGQPLYPGLRIDTDSTAGGSGVLIYTLREGSRSSALARKIYRKNDSSSSWKYVTTIEDNYTTSYIDNYSDASISSNDEISDSNTAATVQGLRFIEYLYKTKPAHLSATVRSNRFRASINSAGDPV